MILEMKKTLKIILDWVIWSILVIGGSVLFAFSDITNLLSNLPIYIPVFDIMPNSFVSVSNSTLMMVVVYVVVISFAPFYKIAAVVTTMILIILLRTFMIWNLIFSSDSIASTKSQLAVIFMVDDTFNVAIVSLLVIAIYILLNKQKEQLKKDTESDTATMTNSVPKKIWSWVWWLIVIAVFGVFNAIVVYGTVMSFGEMLKIPIFDMNIVKIVAATTICFFAYLPFVYMVKHHRILAAVIMLLFSGFLFILLYGDDGCSCVPVYLIIMIYGGAFTAIVLALTVFYVIKRFGFRNDEAVIFKKWW